MMRRPTDWLTPDVRSVAEGLGNAQNLPFRIQNFMMAPDPLTLIRTAKINNGFGLAAFASFL